jgi:hypothetical protein
MGVGLLTDSSMKLPAKIVEIAREEIGVTEVNGSNCGPRVNQYKAATWLDPKQPWPWCAGFVCFVVRQAMAAAGVYETQTFTRPRTAGALDLENWSRDQDATTQTKNQPGLDIEPGDIITFRFQNGGHCGFAISSPDAGGWIETVEGNTDSAGSREGGGVFKKKRHTSKIHGRIRFRV